jgi:uncharacterized membrane protein
LKEAMKKIWPLFVVVGYGLLAWILMQVISHSGLYPAGADVMTHLYKADLIYHSVVQGDLYPAYDPMWYNGAEALRFWAPLSSWAGETC